jgi:hypothetical protein
MNDDLFWASLALFFSLWGDSELCFAALHRLVRCACVFVFVFGFSVYTLAMSVSAREGERERAWCPLFSLLRVPYVEIGRSFVSCAGRGCRRDPCESEKQVGCDFVTSHAASVVHCHCPPHGVCMCLRKMRFDSTSPFCPRRKVSATPVRSGQSVLVSAFCASLND